MRLCKQCLIEKEEEEFYPKRKGGTELQPWCKGCKNAHSKARYASIPELREQIKDRRSRAKRANQEFLLAYLLTHPCEDCGEADPVVLEFDHRDPSAKVTEVSELLTSSRYRLKCEIAKCDVVCANCHRRRTYKQFGFSGKTL